MSRYQLEYLTREPSGKGKDGNDESTPYVMFGTVSASSKRHINASESKCDRVRVETGEAMGIAQYLNQGRLKRYCLLVIEKMTPDELDEANKGEEGYKPFSKEDRADFEAFPEDDLLALHDWWRVREEIVNNHHAEACAILISSIHGTLSLISDKWDSDGWPEMTARQTQVAIDQRAETLLFCLDQRDLDAMFLVAREHYANARLRNGAAKK